MASEERALGATIAGKYLVRRVVGAGSMGVVYEAEHLEIGKRVAIKLIDSTLLGMRDIATRFRREARAASLIESQHIVQVFDVGSDEELGLYLVMELLVGEDLARALARDARLSAETAVRIAVQVARGLARAHEAGVVHRDLKPANIFLCDGEDDHPHVKILDFGISKLIESSRARLTPALKLTRDGMVVGTPQYMSPEQAQGYSVDQRTDIWALGLVLYEMLAGRPAYPELPSYERFIIHLVSEPPDPLGAVAPWITDRLAGVVHAALEHDLTRRIPNCAELIRRLIEASSPSGPTAPDRSTAAETPVGEAQDTLVMSGRPGATASSSAPVAASLLESGIRGAPGEPPSIDEAAQDAPEFFDRRLIAPFAPLAAAPRPVAADAGAPPPAGVAAPDGASGAVSPAPLRRWRWLRWAGLVFAALGLLVATALAWR